MLSECSKLMTIEPNEMIYVRVFVHSVELIIIIINTNEYNQYKTVIM